VLMKPLGHAGIALSTSLVTFAHAVALLLWVPQLRALAVHRPLLASLARAVVAAAVMAVAIRLGGPALKRAGVDAVTVTLAVVVGGAAVYGLMLEAMGGRELREVAGSLRR
jgi:peptidoglycan biosynthesis protein MviN/MurJ (putative lipid II flippase)